MTDIITPIVNRALAAAGARATISQLGENSNEAQSASLHLLPAQKWVLSRARWNFAQAMTVGKIADVSLPVGWQYAYEYPEDCLRIKSLVPQPTASQSVPIFGYALQTIQQPAKTTPFSLMNLQGRRRILSNLPAVQINYTQLVLDMTQWESMAITALELVLASRLAIPLSGDKTLAQKLLQEAEMNMQSAMLADANEDTSVQDVPVDWLTARDGGVCWPHQ